LNFTLLEIFSQALLRDVKGPKNSLSVTRKIPIGLYVKRDSSSSVFQLVVDSSFFFPLVPIIIEYLVTFLPAHLNVGAIPPDQWLCNSMYVVTISNHNS